MPTPRLLKSSAVTLKRPATAQGYYNDDGDWVEATIPVEDHVVIYGNIQPLSGDDIKLLPEAFKDSETLWFYTKTPLKTVDEYNETVADILVIDGYDHKVHKSSNWRYFNSAHYKCLCVKEEKS